MSEGAGDVKEKPRAGKFVFREKGPYFAEIFVGGFHDHSETKCREAQFFSTNRLSRKVSDICG